MKKLKLLALALLIMGTSVFAKENIDPDPVTPMPVLRNQIIELLPKAIFDVEEDTLVRIQFTYNSAGEIVVLRIDSKNRIIKRFISESINNRKVDLPGEVGEIYHLPLKLKVSK